MGKQGFFFVLQTRRDSIRILCLFPNVDVSSGGSWEEVVEKGRMRV